MIKIILIVAATNYSVTDWTWVTVENILPVYNATSGFASGGTCGLEKCGMVQEMAVSGDKSLLRYTAPRRGGGTVCPTGILFFLKKSKLSKKFSKNEANCKTVECCRVKREIRDIIQKHKQKE